MKEKLNKLANHVHAMVRKMKERLRCWKCRMNEWIKKRMQKKHSHR